MMPPRDGAMSGREEEFGDDEHTTVLDANAVPGMVDSMAELATRTAGEGGVCYVKGVGKFFVFQNNAWVPEADDDDEDDDTDW